MQAQEHSSVYDTLITQNSMGMSWYQTGKRVIVALMLRLSLATHLPWVSSNGLTHIYKRVRTYQPTYPWETWWYFHACFPLHSWSIIRRSSPLM